jgi:hypothetical protein
MSLSPLQNGRRRDGVSVPIIDQAIREEFGL